MLRQGDAVKQARLEDESVNHAMTMNAELMQKMKLSQAQKILLRFNVDMKNSCYCYKMTYRTNGHGNVALGPILAMDIVWDLQYVEEMGDYFPWIQRQWDSMCEDTYWDIIGFFLLYWHLLALLRCYSVYNYYEGIVHGINVKEPFVLMFCL